MKIGDRVKVCWRGHAFDGQEGEIICTHGLDHYGVKFDTYHHGRHGLDERVPKGHGWYMVNKFLENTGPLQLEND